MTQNIYDDEVCFQGYGRLPGSVEGLEGAPEWPALRGLLPDLRGSESPRPRLRLRLVLSLGARAGRRRCPRHRCLREAADASEATRNPAISYARADMERLEVPPDSFRLRIQLIGAPLHREARPADGDRVPLAPGGSLVFSVEHPNCTAPVEPGWSVDFRGSQDLADR